MLKAVASFVKNVGTKLTVVVKKTMPPMRRLLFFAFIFLYEKLNSYNLSVRTIIRIIYLTDWRCLI